MDTEVILEEGEITDDELEVEYRPLERPPINISNDTRFQTKCEQSEESDYSSESSDSDNQAKLKKMKMKKKFVPPLSDRRKKYDIWCSHVQEDVLAETLVTCDVNNIDRSRSVESYNFPKYEDTLTQGCKRKHGDRKNVKLRLGTRKMDEEIKVIPRVILDLATTANSSEDDLSQDITNKLCEEKNDLIKKMVKIIGKEKAIAIFKETQRIEKDGGMLIMNGIRRRTPGGVYIFLVKHDCDINKHQIKEIFAEDKKERIQLFRMKQREKMKQMKAKMQELNQTEDLPKLLTRKELIEQQLSEEDEDSKRSDNEELVNNPPPSPVTDAKENSSDGNNESDQSLNRSINIYDDLFENDTTNSMDVF